MIALFISSLAALTIAYQDFKSREVYIFLFPLIFILGTVSYPIENTSNMLLQIGGNILFLVLISIFVIFYFLIKYRRISALSKQIGAGDLLFLISISPYFELKSYMLFLCLSFLICLCVFIPLTYQQKAYPIPLAGFQALLFIPFFLAKASRSGLENLIHRLIF